MASELELFRRTFLGAAASALAACRSDAPTKPPVPTSASPAVETTGLDTAAIEGAEAVLGVEYTRQERTLLLETLQEQIDQAAALRAHPQENALAPATMFDPRLPGATLRASSGGVRGAPVGSATPSGDEDIAFASVGQLGAWLRSGVVTSERLTELYLARLEAHGPELECTVTLTPKRARARAREADRELKAGRDRGPLHGIPWGAKDLFDTAGIRTTWGARPFRDRIPKTDAAVVRALDNAGAVLVGKLATGALAYGDIWFGGRTRNPWMPREGSSGSSAGPAAATAAGLVGFAIGTETLGSIVSPSMRCGTTGLRPTFGRVPRTGCMALCWSLDKVGPITRHVDDAALVLAEIHGQDPGDPASRKTPFAYDGRKNAKGLRVGIVKAWFEDATDLDQAALEALRSTGVEIVPVEIPTLPYSSLFVILQAEAAAAFEALTLSGRDDALTWQSARAWPNTFRAARFVSAVDVVRADRLRREVMVAFDRVFSGVDAVFGPSFAGAMLTATNYTGHPSVTLRAGFEERAPNPFLDGVEPKDTSPARTPYGVTLWGHLHDEGTLCTIARALESALGVATQRPPQ